MSFRLAKVVSSNPIIFINVHSLHQQPARLKMCIDKVEWISAHNYDKPKWHSCTPSFSWKGKILDLDIVSQNVLHRKQTTNQNCWSWYHFSQEIPHPLIPVIASIYVVCHHESHIMSEKKYFSLWQIWILQILSFKSINNLPLYFIVKKIRKQMIES